MKFNTHNDRRKGIRAEADRLGKAYADLKYAEAMFREMVNSFVPGEPETATATFPIGKPGELIEVDKNMKPVAMSKRASKPKVKLEQKPEPEVKVTVNEPEPEMSIEGLRKFMTDRYIEAGKTPEAMAKIRGALEKATGKSQVAELADHPEQIPLGYKAIEEVEL